MTDMAIKDEIEDLRTENRSDHREMRADIKRLSRAVWIMAGLMGAAGATTGISSYVARPSQSASVQEVSHDTDEKLAARRADHRRRHHERLRDGDRGRDSLTITPADPGDD